MSETILKKRVDMSTGNFLFTLLGIGVVICACILLFKRSDNEAWVWLLMAYITIWGFLVLYYCPMYIRLREDSLNVETSLRIKSFPLKEIAEVKICPPEAAEKRVVGSRFAFCYWGWMNNPVIGRYFAYYGIPSQTFLIRLKSGRRYMLGCRDSKEMAEALADQLTKNTKK